MAPTGFTNTNGVTVTWVDYDANGVSMYDVQYQKDGGGWSDLRSNITAQSWRFGWEPPLTEGVYGFRARARDVVGNQGNWPTTAQVTTTFDCTTPQATLALSEYSSTIPVTWSAADSQAGLTGVYTVSVMTDTGPLQMWLNGVAYTSANFTATLGHKYTFVVSATDRVSNVGHASAEAATIRVTKYYYIGATRAAMWQGNEVTYLHIDHSSASLTAGSGTVNFATKPI